jgi:hypothetical protein
MSTLRISVFRSARDNRPQPLELEWDALVGKLRAARRSPCTMADCIGKLCPHKPGAAWSPASYAPGAKRAKANVQTVSVLVLDHDDITTEQICEIEGRLRHHRRILHATHNDRPGDGATRRIRSVIEMSQPVPGDKWPLAWPSIVDRLELPGVDRAACDASRLYFAPTRPSDAPYFFHAAEAAS